MYKLEFCLEKTYIILMMYLDQKERKVEMNISLLAENQKNSFRNIENLYIVYLYISI